MIDCRLSWLISESILCFFLFILNIDFVQVFILKSTPESWNFEEPNQEYICMSMIDFRFWMLSKGYTWMPIDFVWFIHVIPIWFESQSIMNESQNLNESMMLIGMKFDLRSIGCCRWTGLIEWKAKICWSVVCWWRINVSESILSSWRCRLGLTQCWFQKGKWSDANIEGLKVGNELEKVWNWFWFWSLMLKILMFR